MNDDDPEADRRSFIRAFGVWSSIGIQLSVSVVAGLYAGKWLDENFGTEPLFIVTGVILGTAAGFYGLVRLVAQQKGRPRDGDR